MALRECPACTKPVSTEALACPHCGQPLHHTVTRRTRRRELLLVLALVIVFAMFYGREEPGKQTPQPTVADSCTTINTTRLIQQAMSSGILHRIDGKPEVSHIYVLEPWARLTIDEKKGLDVMLKCAVTQGAPNDRTIVVYYDGRTGKELATSTRNGFTVE